MQLTGQNSNLRLPWGGSTVDRVGRFQPLPGLAATPAHNRTRRKGTEKARPKREAASAGQSSPSGQAGAGSPVPAAHLEAEWARWGVPCASTSPHICPRCPRRLDHLAALSALPLFPCTILQPALSLSMLLPCFSLQVEHKHHPICCYSCHLLSPP